jgi:hypothetical protein
MSAYGLPAFAVPESFIIGNTTQTGVLTEGSAGSRLRA